MEHWERLLSDYTKSSDFRYYFKVSQTANAALKEDLALFEIEWITETLLYNPISLLEVITTKRMDEAWFQVIGDSFKVLAEIVAKHWSAVQKHIENIIACCELSYDAETRKQAIHCLIAILKRPEVRLDDINRHIRALEEATTCKTPLAVLVGVICEYHRDEVEMEYQRIWRIFINILGSNSKTQTVTKAVLQGISGLFQSFGEQLPTAELNNIFYNKMAKDYVRITICEEVVFKILEHHAKLFGERLAEDKDLREYIWGLVAQRNGKNGASALRSIYQAVSVVMDANRFETVLESEVLPRSQHSRPLVKFTALRILSRAGSRHSASAALACSADWLQAELGGAVTYERAEAVCFCIEAYSKDSERLLQAAILSVENLPANKRREIVTCGILNAPDDIRRKAVSFLINQSCSLDGSQDTLAKFLPLWTELLDCPTEERSQYVFEDAISHLLMEFVTIGQDSAARPAQLMALLLLTSRIVSITPIDYYTTPACRVLVPVLVKLSKQFGVDAPLLSALRAAVVHMEDCDIGSLDDVIEIDGCRDEATLCESCLLLIQASRRVGDTDAMMSAFRIIFSRSDVEPKFLSLALKEFRSLLDTDMSRIPERVTHEIVDLIERLRSRKDLTGKDARVLHRDIIMFLGVYGNDRRLSHNGDISVVRMKELLNLSLPNALEGTRPLQMNLQSLLAIATTSEEPLILRTLLTIVIANWDGVMARATAERLTMAGRLVARLMHAACRAHSHARDFSVAALQRAAALCDADCIISYISEEVSPGARRMLSDCLEELLTKEHATEVHPINTVCERVAMMIAGDDQTAVKAGLDIAQSLIPALEDHNELSVVYLPRTLTNAAKIRNDHARTVFAFASNAFADKKELFEDSIEKFAEELVFNNLKYPIKDLQPYKRMLQSILEFYKETLYDSSEETIAKLTDSILACFEEFDFENVLHVLAALKSVFDFDLEVCRKICGYREGVVMNGLFETKVVGCDGLAKWDGVLMFLKEYAVVLLEYQYQKTLQYIGELIKVITPNMVIELETVLTACLSEYRAQLKRFPTGLTSSFEHCCEAWRIEDIRIDDFTYSDFIYHSTEVNALRIMTDIFHDTPVYTTKVWTEKLLELYRAGRFEGLQIKMVAIQDVLSISSKHLTLDDVKRLFLNDKMAIKFCREFVDVLLDKLLSKPFVLLDAPDDSSTLLLDVVGCFLRRKCPEDMYDSVLELIDQLWPKFEVHASFNDKQSLLIDLLRFPNKVDPESKPVQWAVGVLSSRDGDRHDKIKLIGLLPAGEQFRACYRSYASCLPTRLSEMQGEHSAMFRGLLDALAATGDMTLFGIVLTLAAGDDTKGWWDDALDSCMGALALKADKDMYELAHRRCWDGLTLGICRRVLVPLLRYSSARFCEEFFSNVISDLFAVLRRGHRTPSPSREYQKSVVTYIKVFSVLEVGFEKIAYESLESANSVLHQHLEDKKAWASTTGACKLCVSLRDRVTCPDGAPEALRESCRLFHCAAYNCLASAICRKKPDERFYNFIFDSKIWASLVDDGAVYRLYIQSRWRHRGTRRHAVSIDVADGTPLSSLTSRTVGTRLFMRTLSENPLQYDMIEDEEQPTTTQELQLTDSELNAHECAATLGALLRHAACLPHADWRRKLAAALAGPAPRHARWLLAQAVCNVEEDLRDHAEHLREPLLRMVVDTAVGEEKLLNGLHVDVLNVLANWSDEPEISDKSCLNTTVHYLLNTCLHFSHMQSVYKSVLDTIDRLLKVYGHMVTVSWSVLEKHIHEKPKDATIHLQILQHLLRNNIYIPQLLPTILDKYDAKYWRSTPRLAEVFGLAANLCPESEREGVLYKFRSILDKIKATDVGSFVKVLYNAQKWCKGCCDERHFRMIADLAQKIEKPKCLTIISTYMDHLSSPSDHQLITDVFHTMSICELVTDDRVDVMRLAMNLVKNGLKFMDDVFKRRLVLLVANLCSNSVVEVRRAAFGVIMKAFEDLFPSSDAHPPSKRQKTELTPLLRLLDTEDTYTRTIVENVSCGVLDRDQTTSELMMSQIEKYLSEDFSARYAECFYITIYLPYKCKGGPFELSACLSTLLGLLFTRLRGDDGFRERRLREDDPMETSSFDDVGSSKLMTLSSSYQGTFRSTSYGGKVSIPKTQGPTQSDVDVTMPLVDVLNAILEFSKTNPDAAQAVCVQIMRRLRGSPGFGFDAVMSRQLAGMMCRSPNCLTPFVLDTCLVFVDAVSGVSGFTESVEILNRFTRGSDGFEATKLLHEDVLIRCKDAELFMLGIVKDEYDITMYGGSREFSLEDLVSAFGKLSNWDDLRSQDRRRVQAEGVPLLWTRTEDFTEELRQYLSVREACDSLWFDKMAISYSGGGKQDAVRWLREIDEFPRRQFVVSAVAEAVLWQQECPEFTPSCDPRASECLAEWAARLMLRSAQVPVESSQHSTLTADCRWQELRWCTEANRRGLPRLAQQCIDRNKENLRSTEVLAWSRQSVIALRTIGLESMDNSLLHDALKKAEISMSMFKENSTIDECYEMENLILQLNYDLKTLSKDKLADALKRVSEIMDLHERMSSSKFTDNNAKVLRSIYDLVTIYYDDLYSESEGESRDGIIADMAAGIGQVMDKGLANNHDMLFAMLFNRLDAHDEVLSEGTAKVLLEQLSQALPKLDSFSVAAVKRILRLLPADVAREYPHVASSCLQQEELLSCRRWLQLVCSAPYSLRGYCLALDAALKANDATTWTKTFDTMKSKIFENPHAGSDYRLLARYKKRLYDLYKYANTPATAKALREIIKELDLKKHQQSTLRMSQLCSNVDALLQKRQSLNKLLALNNTYVVKFYEEVSVFLDSVRRPCVMKVLLSNGRTRRYLHKTGEPLATDAALQRCAGALPLLCAADFRGYNVTPLSEDCGLIEYLEDHERLRALMMSVHNLDEGVIRADDNQLILSPAQALQSYHSICAKIPRHALRSAVEQHSTCTEDYIAKKRTFLDTLSSMTVVNWIFGVGDRHLENIMYCVRDGGVCGVDWAGSLHYGAAELPPARLTPALLAVCDLTVLECRLQSIMTSLRQSHRVYTAYICISFQCMGQEFQDKFSYIRDTLEGKTLSHHVTKDSLQKSKKIHKEKYIQLLDQVFECVTKKPMYSLEEQVSCFLKQCTDPSILSVTRRGWEPWV